MCSDSSEHYRWCDCKQTKGKISKWPSPCSNYTFLVTTGLHELMETTYTHWPLHEVHLYYLIKSNKAGLVSCVLVYHKNISESEVGLTFYILFTEFGFR